jgi:hypothetical protein
LSSSIISGVLLPQFAIIPLAVILVYMGLMRGIAPLRLLQERIHRRRPSDLSPIPVTGVPDEVRPLVVAFNQMMGRLEENLQAQQRFIAQAAHQMRTPLTGLKTQTEIALSETDPAQMRLALQLIAESTDRASHMINQLLILARAEASHEKLHQVVPLDLNALARRGHRGMGGTRAWPSASTSASRIAAAARHDQRRTPAAARTADQPGRQRGQVHPAGGMSRCAPGGNLEGGRGRRRRHRHSAGGTRKRIRALLPRAGHRCRGQRTGPADRRRDCRTAPGQDRPAERRQRPGSLFRVSFPRYRPVEAGAEPTLQAGFREASPSACKLGCKLPVRIVVGQCPYLGAIGVNYFLAAVPGIR